jgi:uncharacterized cysteine cluster protein YcgN (CxxCxxCC family)
VKTQKTHLNHPAACRPFWKAMPLEQMSREQWESLCDGCGRCCLQKFQDGKTGKVTYTWVSCYLLDVQGCHCTDYGNRTTLVPDLPGADAAADSPPSLASQNLCLPATV